MTHSDIILKQKHGGNGTVILEAINVTLSTGKKSNIYTIHTNTG